MFGSIGTPELILILAVVILLFGIGRITKLGGELGGAVRAFRQGLSGEDDKAENKGDNEKTA